jgi:hypothetical protein
MTTAFQNVIDNAASIAMSKRKKVSQTVSRDGTVKATSLGGQLWQFEVTLPNGPRWTDYRGIIEQAEALDRVTLGTIQINSAGHDWLSGYQGDLTSTSSITVSYTSGNTITITGGADGLQPTQLRFKSGDLIQLGSSGRVYSVVNDVAYNENTVTLHRPVREAAGNYTLIVGQNVTWTVICSQFPQWTIFARDQVSWSGPFVFVEAA